MQEQAQTQEQQAWLAPQFRRRIAKRWRGWAPVGAQAARHRSHEGQSKPLFHIESHVDAPVAPRPPLVPSPATPRPDSSAAQQLSPPFSRSTVKATTGRQSGNSPRSFPPPHARLHKHAHQQELVNLDPSVPQAQPLRQSAAHAQPGGQASQAARAAGSTSLSGENRLQRGHRRKRTAASVPLHSQATARDDERARRRQTHSIDSTSTTLANPPPFLPHEPRTRTAAPVLLSKEGKQTNGNPTPNNNKLLVEVVPRRQLH